MLADLFESLDGEIKSLIANIKSVDPLYVLFDFFLKLSIHFYLLVFFKYCSLFICSYE